MSRGARIQNQEAARNFRAAGEEASAPTQAVQPRRLSLRGFATSGETSLFVRANGQKKIVIWAVTVTPPWLGEFGKGPLSETPKLMSPGRSLAILLAASTASLIGST